jgi:hypothetical protein
LQSVYIYILKKIIKKIKEILLDFIYCIRVEKWPWHKKKHKLEHGEFE